MIKVKSSNIGSYGYDDDTQTLRIVFLTNESTYDYFHVPPHVAQELARRKRMGESIGAYVHQAVIGPNRKRPLYAFVKIN